MSLMNETSFHEHDGKYALDGAIDKSKGLQYEANFHEHDGKYRLTEPIVYYSKRLDKVIVVPTAAKPSDLASVPAPFRPLVKTSGRITYAAIVHDWLYDTKGLIDRVTKAEADLVFLDIMEERDMPKIRRRIAYRGVRMNFPADKSWHEDV